MEVLFLINSLANRSGSERVAVELVNKLSKLSSYNITIINRDSSKENCAYIVEDKVKVKVIKGNPINFIIKLKNDIISNDYDVVVVHNMGKLSLLVSLLPKVKKLVSLEHISFVSRPKVIQILSGFLYKKIDQVVTLTNSDKNQFDKIHSNVITIPNFSPFQVKEKDTQLKKTILSIGRLSDQKNYVHLIEAWNIINDKIPEWKLNIYGEGEQEAYLRLLINEYKLKNIYLKGSISNVIQAYEESDFFVMSSKYEGLPMVLIEAQSFGLPIISYNCPHGPADIVHNNVNGYLVEDQNIKELSDAILKLANSVDTLDLFSKNSLINAHKFQFDRIIKIWKDNVFNE